MKKNLVLFPLLVSVLYSCGQSTPSTPEQLTTDNTSLDSLEATRDSLRSQKYDPQTYIYSDSTYTDVSGRNIRIQNSFPKGGGYLDLSSSSIGFSPFNNISYGHAVFWTRVINESDAPLELSINFPADSLAIFPATPEAHLKLFIPPATMTLDKVAQYSYGITGLESYLTANFYKPSILQRTIAPKEEWIFYVALLSHIPEVSPGPRRTGLILDGKTLYYQISTTLPETYLMPCGELVFKE